MSGRADGVSPSATTVTLSLPYRDRLLAMLSLVRQAAVRLDTDGRRPQWWVSPSLSEVSWGALVGWDAVMLERLRVAGAIRVRSTGAGLMTLSDLGEALGPLWLAYAKATGREARVLEMVQAAAAAPPVPPEASPLRGYPAPDSDEFPPGLRLQ